MVMPVVAITMAVFLVSTLKAQYINILILMSMKRCEKAMLFITVY